MVKSRLVDISVSRGKQAESLSAEIGNLDIRALHQIKDEKDIERLRNTIISAVSDALLVHVDEGELEKRKNKQAKDAPLKYTGDMIWKEGATIRSELTSEGEKIALPRGWIWQDTNEEVIGCIYKKSEMQGYGVLVHRDIADNPHGSSVLITEMKKMIKKLIPKSKQKNNIRVEIVNRLSVKIKE